MNPANGADEAEVVEDASDADEVGKIFDGVETELAIGVVGAEGFAGVVVCLLGVEGLLKLSELLLALALAAAAAAVCSSSALRSNDCCPERSQSQAFITSCRKCAASSLGVHAIS